MNIKSFILMTVACLSGCLIYGQGVVFVKYHEPNTYYTGYGTSWDSPLDYISQGIQALGEEGGTVYVKVGLYYESNLTVPANVTIKGGYMYSASGTDTTLRNFPGDNSHWEDERYCTLISTVTAGKASERVAMVYGAIEGCVVSNGCSSTYGGGLYLDGGVARHCVIKECDAIDDLYGKAQGGGVYMCNNAQLINCVVTDCRADDGAAVAGSNSTLINNTITNNYAMSCGQLRDYDGNVYNTVVIGKQCWMRDNLRTSHYADGTPIARGYSTSTETPYYYLDSVALTATLLQKYGFMYNWAAVMHGAPATNANPSGVQGVCPDGWHVPSQPEVKQMLDFLKTQTRFWCYTGYNSTAKSLCCTDNVGYGSYDCRPVTYTDRNNATRFTAYPAWTYDGNYGSGTANYYTTSLRQEDNTAYIMYISWGEYDVPESYTNPPQNGLSVRCLKNY